MNKNAQLVFLSCKKASYLIEKKQIDELSVIENIQMKMHISMCEICKMYEKQSGLVHGYLFNYSQKNVKETTLSNEKKSEIIDELKKLKQ